MMGSPLVRNAASSSSSTRQLPFSLLRRPARRLNLVFSFSPIKVACSANPEDLWQFVHVSKVIQHAAVISKDSYFDRTPLEAMRSDLDEAPLAPKRLRRMNSAQIGKNMALVESFVVEEEEELRWLEMTRQSI